MVKRENFSGYGFNLHAEKNKPGQFIGKVDPNSPAEDAGLQDGDRIVEVNGVNISQENHKQASKTDFSALCAAIGSVGLQSRLHSDQQSLHFFSKQKISILIAVEAGKNFCQLNVWKTTRQLHVVKWEF